MLHSITCRTRVRRKCSIIAILMPGQYHFMAYYFPLLLRFRGKIICKLQFMGYLNKQIDLQKQGHWTNNVVNSTWH